MRRGIDIDGVLRNFDKAFAKTMRFAPEKLSYTVMAQLEKPARAYDEKLELVGGTNWRWFWQVGAPLYRSLAKAPAYCGELEALAKLDGEDFLITSQPMHLRDQTFEWLASNHVATEGVLHVSHPDEKLEFINALHLDMFVEDRMETLTKLVGNTEAQLFVLDRPWNRDGQVHAGIERIKSLKALL